MRDRLKSKPVAKRAGGRASVPVPCRVGFAPAATAKGASAFSKLNDGSSLANVQVIADGTLANYESEVKHLAAGASVTVEGLVKASPAKGQATEIQAERDRSYTAWPIPRRYPLQKKHHSFEFLRTIGHLRPRTNTFGAVDAGAQLRQPLDSQFFPGRRLPLHPRPDHHRQRLRGGRRDVQGHRPSTWRKFPRHRPARSTSPQDFFDRPAFLTVSGQLQAEIFACSLGKVYTFGPTFRAENSNTSRHLAEFWMIEPEMAFFELTDNMDLAEQFLKRIFRDVLANSARGYGVLPRAHRQDA